MSASPDNELLERLVTAAVAAVLRELRAADAGRRAGRRVPILVCNDARGLDFAAASLATLGDLPVTLEWIVASGPMGRVTPETVRRLCPSAEVRESGEAEATRGLRRVRPR